MIPILRLAAASLRNRRGTVALTVLAVAVAVALFAGVEKLRTAAREGFSNTLSGTDLVVGARSSPVNLMLYAVFRIGDATNNITWESYRQFADRPEVAWTVPLSLGDSHRGFRVMGTTAEYFEHYRYGNREPLRLAAGRPFADLFDTVLGADVARALGYTLGKRIVLTHGLGGFADHDNMPFTVTGILEPTGTPVDRTIHVSLEAIEAIHLGWQSGSRTPLATRITPEQARSLALRPKQITAFLVGLNTKTALLRIQRDIATFRDEPLQAAVPGVALAELWQVVGVAERALALVAGFVVLVGLVGVITSILTSLNERRREMAILRAVGAHPWHIFALLIVESALIAVAGGVLGLAAVQIGLAVAAPMAAARYGVPLSGIGFGVSDLGVLASVTGAAVLLAAVPAWRAVRTALADGLTLRV